MKNQIYPLCCAALLLSASLLPAEPQTNAAPRAALPLLRANYIIGESLPVALRGSPAKRRVELRDAAGKVAVSWTGTAQALRLDTARLAAGEYELWVDGQPSGIKLGLVSPIRSSSAALCDESRPDVSTVEHSSGTQRVLRETGINALMEVGLGAIGRDGVNDAAATTGALLFYNPYNRAMSFFPARVEAGELKTFRHRLALAAQANGRYPTFGGFYYDWDPTAFLNRIMLPFYYGWEGQEQALRKYIARSDQAVFDDFKRRTGLKPVTTSEYIRYCASIGRPEFAPALDLPTYRWIEALSRSLPPLPKEQLLGLEQRLDAWGRYLMGLYGESYAGHNAVLREIIPSLRHTTSINLDHAAVRDGQYTPSAYAPLDFRYMTAWNDALPPPDYPYQWLFSAGMLDAGRPHDQPTWIASSLGTVFNLAAYPGRFMRMAGHNLAYGGRGLGFSCEGYSTVLASMWAGTVWGNMKGKSGAEDLIGGRDFLKRFAGLSAAGNEVRRVGLLYSKSQMARQHLGQIIDTPLFNCFISLARLGYTPRLVTEEEIEANALTGMRQLVVVNQSVPLPPAVIEKLRVFVYQAGGQILVDRASQVEIPGAARVDLALPYARPGKPHNWAVPNIADVPPAVFVDTRHAQVAPPLLAALGDAQRTPLTAKSGALSKVSTFELDGGPEARYVVAVNDAIVAHHSQWVRLSEELVPNGVVTGVLYDLTAETALGPVGPVRCRFEDLTARLYALLKRPVASLSLKATQSLEAGTDLRLSLAFVAEDGQPLKAVIPFCLTFNRPTGAPAAELFRATDRDGHFAMTWPVAANEAPGDWTLTARSLLDGRTATLPVAVKAGRSVELFPLAEPVIVRGSGQIRALLAKEKAFVLPVFGGPTQTDILVAAKSVRDSLAKQGCAVEVREHPTFSTYIMGYDPSAAELAENAKAEKGESIGRIKVTTSYRGMRNDYFGTQGGYIFGKPIILLDLVGSSRAPGAKGDNEMAAQLDALGALWPKADENFPGSGKATLQLVKSAFMLGVDALVIQAADVPGLLAGAKSLKRLPEDWLTPSVEGARATLLSQLGIGSDRSVPTPEHGLSAKGLRSGKAPQPLALRFPEKTPPAAADVKPFVPAPPPTNAIPGEVKAEQLTACYRVGDAYEHCVVPGGAWPGDCRFQDAVRLRLVTEQAARFTVTIQGTFRYSDRKPCSQSTWEEVLALYNAIPKQRRAMVFDAQINGQAAGSLATLVTGEKDVTVENSLGGSPPKVAREELVTQINGTLDLPAGTNDVLFIHRNIVDGKIEKIALTR